MIFGLFACAAPPPPPPDGPDVILVVMDTVRADRSSLCGYARPTTPNLAALAARGSARCDARSPAPWTLPAHASFFTGLSPLEHGADYRRGGGPSGHGVIGLDPGFETLAEHFSTLGYDTAIFSQNPVVDEDSGLLQGFTTRWTGGHYFPRTTDRLLAELDAWLRPREDRPFFLVVNLVEAHMPLPRVPEGLDWLPPRSGMVCPNEWPGPCRSYVTGHLEAAPAQDFLAELGDLYDYGVFREDVVLGEVLARLEAARRLEHARLVVTSDHGELLGEHGWVGHSEYLWEELVEVFLVAWSSAGPIPLPAAPSTLVVHDLLRAGRVERTPPPLSVGLPNGNAALFSEGLLHPEPAVAWREGPLKYVVEKGRQRRHRLDLDPDERRHERVPLEPERRQTWERARDLWRVEAPPSALTEQLQALGYM